MSIPNNCGCSTPSCGCSSTVQSPPTPCCESHNTMYVAGICLHVSCELVSNDSEEGFPIGFSNLYDTLPVDANHTFFYHAAAGFMRIVGVTSKGFYQVILTDPSKKGRLIKKEDCVTLYIKGDEALTGSLYQRCVTGIFSAPAVNAVQTIYIENGTSLPIGATLTFTYEGETGSYTITAYKGASGNVYAYDVQNAGNGITPGVQINGGAEGTCAVPVEVITSLEVCNLSATQNVDSLTGCLNGAARSLTSTSTTDVVIGNGSGGFGLGKLPEVDCCVVTEGVLKFSGNTCTTGSDSVVISPSNIACFLAAWAEVSSNNIPVNIHGIGQTKLPMNINGYKVVVTAYDAGTRRVTFSPVAALGGSTVEFPTGTQICIGSECAGCLNGPRVTNHRNLGLVDPRLSSLFYYNTTAQLSWDAGNKHRYLVGFQYNTLPLTTIVTELTTGYNTATIPLKPAITDPLLMRSKICNNSVKGCDQMAELQWNYELGFHPVPAGVRISWEIGHAASDSKTLADNTTSNPFSSVATQQSEAGYLVGPTTLDANSTIDQTIIGIGSDNGPKIFPFHAGTFRDSIYLEKCNCAMSIMWLYVETEVLADGPGGTGVFNSTLRIRQSHKYFDANEAPIPINEPYSEGFK